MSVSHIKTEIETLHHEIPENVTLVAVSKFHEAADIKAAYEAGQRVFGESRVQELISKIPMLPSDIKWHFIGHLQTNKVRQIIGKVHLIESVDSEKLLNLIDAESRKAGVITRVLMQVHVALEETKFGFDVDDLLDYFAEKRFESLTNTHICGIMGMASNTDDIQRITADFAAISGVYRTIADNAELGLRGFDTISMGMSDDWQIAVAQGSNMIRIGTRIFGPRQY